MSHIAPLFSERGRVIALAAELRCPAQTVYSWKNNGSIPRWWRMAVLNAARSLNIELPDETILYLSKVF